MKSPRHLAIIMDGNGRWAQAKNKNRFWGHLKGASVTQEIVQHCAKNTNIECLSLFAFSTENWSRPKEEVLFLFKLLDHHLKKKEKEFIESNIKLSVMGDLSALPKSLQNRIQSVVTNTQHNTGLKLNLGLNYGGRQEILNAVNSYLSENPGATHLSELDFERHLYTNPMPAPDLIIRTSGEMRLSNFMLWQSAYSEFFFTKTLWPDFKATDLNLALESYACRERRFGKVPTQKEIPPQQFQGTQT